MLDCESVTTLLGEKLETIMVRETANTRMRDFYDIHILMSQKAVDCQVLKSAFLATSEKTCDNGACSPY